VHEDTVQNSLKKYLQNPFKHLGDILAEVHAFLIMWPPVELNTGVKTHAQEIAVLLSYQEPVVSTTTDYAKL
jgi:hypothetical protein